MKNMSNAKNSERPPPEGCGTHGVRENSEDLKKKRGQRGTDTLCD